MSSQTNNPKYAILAAIYIVTYGGFFFFGSFEGNAHGQIKHETQTLPAIVPKSRDEVLQQEVPLTCNAMPQPASPHHSC